MTEIEEKADSLTLDDRIAALEVGLNRRQKLFALNMAARPVTNKEAAQRAGYSEVSARTRASQMLQNETIVALIECYTQKDRLENGLPASYKRAHLTKIIEADTTRNADRINAVKVLMDLDGDTKTEIDGNVQIIIQMPFSTPNLECAPVIEGEVVEADQDSLAALDFGKRGGDGR